MEQDLIKYIEFKTHQLIRLTAFDSKQENAEIKLKAMVKPKLNDWVKEFKFSVK